MQSLQCGVRFNHCLLFWPGPEPREGEAPGEAVQTAQEEEAAGRLKVASLLDGESAMETGGRMTIKGLYL